MNKTCEICNGEQHDPTDHPYLPVYETSPLDILETHNPLDIIQEKNMGVKDDVDEGGAGSGRHTENPGDPQGGPQGQLIAFETVSVPGSASAIDIGGKKLNETITKQLMDNGLICPCKRKATQNK